MPTALTFLPLLLLLVPHIQAVPKTPPSHDHWAQLLLADRYTLFKRPEWYTHGEIPIEQLLAAEPPSNNASASTLHQSSHNPSTSSTPNSHLRSHVAVRTKIIPPKGINSKFEIHVYGEPAGLQIDRVLLKCQEVIEESWVSNVVVLMKVSFTNLGGPDVLAKGGGTFFVKLPDKTDTALPVGAAEAVRGYDINSNEGGDGKYDVLVTLNSQTPWFDGTTGECPPDRYDMVTVILHEVYHNLVFAGSIVADVSKDPNAVGGVRQEAYLYKGYYTRYDCFLANKDGCAVLDYLTDTQLQQQLNRKSTELLADACTNSALYFSYGENTQVAKLYAPRVFKRKSSVYHIDLTSSKEDSLMFPTILRGSKQHLVSSRIRNIQAATINTNLVGANRNCKRPLTNPIAGGGATDSDFKEPEGVVDATPLPAPGGVKEDNVGLVAGLPVWGFVLIIIFAVLLLLLLLGLCLALLLRRKKKKTQRTQSFRSYASAKPSTHSAFGGRVSRSDRKSYEQYRPGMGGKASSTSRRTRSKSRSDSITKPISKSDHRSYRRSSSRHTAPSKGSSKRTASKHTVSKTDTECKRPAICPSSGKSRYICGCVCCCPGQTVSRPPPVASVHTFDPNSVPTVRHKTTTHKSCHYRTGGDNTVNKICKSKTIRTCHHGCHCCHCCRYKPASHKSSSKCSKSVARSSSTKCRTKCETVCETSTRGTSSRCSPSTKLSSTKASSRPAPPSTKPPVYCKPASSRKKCCTSSCRKCTRVVEINVGYKC